MLLWGIGMGALESIVRAVVASIVPSDRRATGYGIFNAGFGLAWFAGSAVMGFLYDSSIISLAVFSVAFQAASLPIVYTVNRRTLRTSDCGGN
jgi:MFS family permease